jgi:muramoyltetrapeptide carboxypeptidase LdcA involved in peptidoglycan recycling
MRKPSVKGQKLRRGDTIGIVSPSWGGAAKFPHRLERGMAQLAALGYDVKVGRHALNTLGFVSDHPEHRVSDFHDLFADPSVRLVLAAIGGDHSCHLLPLLDFELIRNNPKPLVGFSDVTVLNVAIWQAAGLVTFNGPALLTDFAEHPEMLAYTRDWFSRAVAGAGAIGRITPAPAWTEETPDWAAKSDLERPRVMQPSNGWTWLKGGSGEGMLIGGCLESLQHLRGTRFWPDWHEAILFFETSEERPSPATVDGILMDYENMGVFEDLRGMLVGRPMRYSDAQKAQLREVILDRTRRYDFPIVTDMDFGHTSPQFTIPIGCRARIDSPLQIFEILEPGVL